MAGRITIDNFSEELIEYMNKMGLTEEQVINIIKGNVTGELEGLATNDKSSIVAAINELFQNANNGKELIANAIGEPVSKDDTFQAMSNNINGLLSTFKTNMMNNGITVNSSDRFKSLIDKIATMVEDGGNKGIQFASGSYAITSTTSDGSTYYMAQGEIPFKPTVLLVEFYSGTLGDGLLYFNEFTDTSNFKIIRGGSYNTPISHLGGYITDSGFLLTIGATSSLTVKQYYAIGVGEEDTSLRDSLANILEEEGVEITEEDDMASLITKVDEEFDRKNNSKGLDIISATELPENGKEGQICVITNNPVDNILVTSSVADVQSEGINIYLGNSSSDDISMGTVLPVSSNGITMNYYFNRIYQGSERLESYYYSNNTWNQLTKKYIPIFEDGVATNTTLNPALNCIGASITNSELVFNASAQGDFYLVYTDNRINFNDISKIEVDLKKNWVNGNYDVMIYVASTDNPNSYNNMVVNQSYRYISSTDYFTWTIDTTSWTGSHYLMIQKYNEYSGLCCYIKSIRLY